MTIIAIEHLHYVSREPVHEGNTYSNATVNKNSGADQAITNIGIALLPFDIVEGSFDEQWLRIRESVQSCQEPFARSRPNKLTLQVLSEA